MPDKQQGKTLSEHAAYELVKAGVTNSDDPELRQVAVNVMALIRRIEKMNMTTKQAEYALQAFDVLTQFLPLSPITDDPEEWDKFEIDRKNVDTQEVEKREVWQSRRATSIFSEDKGKTFVDQRTGKTGTSVDHVEYAKQQEAEKEARTKAKEEAKNRTANKPTAVLADTPAGEEAPAPTNTTLEVQDGTHDQAAETPGETPQEETK